jgi:hypothetical protein
MRTTIGTRTGIGIGILAAALLSACGNGGGGAEVASLGGDEGETASTLSAEDTEEALLDWVSCMREHGIDMPDPSTDADGNLVLEPMIIQAGEGEELPEPPDREEMQAADADCGRPPEGAFGGDGPMDREQMQEDMLALAECMRDNGIADFPDPDFSDMGPGVVELDADEEPAGGMGGGVRIGGPFGEDVDMDDPEVQAAFETCAEEVGMPGPVVASSSAGASGADE